MKTSGGGDLRDKGEGRWKCKNYTLLCLCGGSMPWCKAWRRIAFGKALALRLISRGSCCGLGRGGSDEASGKSDYVCRVEPAADRVFHRKDNHHSNHTIGTAAAGE